jgi:hypothetical protein
MINVKNEDDKAWVTLERTINLGNYESIKISAGVSRTIHKDDEPMDVLDVICDEVNEVLLTKSREYKKLYTPKIRREE